MKNLLKLSLILLVAVTALLTGCNKDEPITPEPEKTGPKIEILPTSFHDTLTTTDTSALYTLNVKADTGSAELKAFTVYRDGAKLDLNDFLINSSQPSANPVLIVDANEKTGFEWKVDIRTPNTYGTSMYTVEVEDENGLKAADTIIVIVNQPNVNTPIDTLITGSKFWNNAGPMKGGVDLLDGSAQSTVSGSPHIKDNGLDSNANWKKTLSPVGSVDLRSLPAGSDFDGVQYKEEIADMYDGGTSVSETAPVSIGDVFAADVNGTKVLFKITDIVETSSDNNDYYIISIKH